MAYPLLGQGFNVTLQNFPIIVQRPNVKTWSSLFRAFPRLDGKNSLGLVWLNQQLINALRLISLSKNVEQ